MLYILCGVIAVLIFSALTYLLTEEVELSDVGVCILIVIVSFSIIVVADYKIQTNDNEIWSGKITKVEHIEEWDQ